jgi:hypothetical protein
MTVRTLFPLLLTVACDPQLEEVVRDTESDTDTDADTDTDTDSDADTDTDTDTDVPEIVGTMMVTDYTTTAAIDRVDVTIDGETYDTDTTGIASVEAPGNSSFAAELYRSSYMRTSVFLTTDEAPFAAEHALWTQSFLTTLERAFGVTYDETLATVFVHVEVSDGAGGWTTAAGATVDLDVAYAGTFHGRGEAYASGNTLEEDSSSFVVFGNVTPGTVIVSVTPPNAETCTTFPSTTRFDGEIVATADRSSSLLVRCQ